MKILKFKLLIFLEYKNVKILLQRFTLQIYLKKFLRLKKLKILYHEHKKKSKEFRIEKIIKTKSDKSCVKWRGYNHLFNSKINKEYIVEMSEYFPKLKSVRAYVKVELNFSNYPTKADLKRAAGVDTSSRLI